MRRRRYLAALVVCGVTLAVSAGACFDLGRFCAGDECSLGSGGDGGTAGLGGGGGVGGSASAALAVSWAFAYPNPCGSHRIADIALHVDELLVAGSFEGDLVLGDRVLAGTEASQIFVASLDNASGALRWAAAIGPDGVTPAVMGSSVALTCSAEGGSGGAATCAAGGGGGSGGGGASSAGLTAKTIAIDLDSGDVIVGADLAADARFGSCNAAKSEALFLRISQDGTAIAWSRAFFSGGSVAAEGATVHGREDLFVTGPFGQTLASEDCSAGAGGSGGSGGAGGAGPGGTGGGGGAGGSLVSVGSRDVYVGKLAVETGEPVWLQSYGGAAFDSSRAVAAIDHDMASSVVVTGTIGEDACFDGGEWSPGSGGAATDCQACPGHFLPTAGPSKPDLFAAAIDGTAATTSWALRLGNDNAGESGVRVVPSKDGVLIAGYARSFGDWSLGARNCVAPDSGSFDNGGDGSQQAFLMEVSPSGQPLRLRALNGQSVQNAVRIGQLPGGDAIIAGTTTGALLDWTSERPTLGPDSGATAGFVAMFTPEGGAGGGLPSWNGSYATLLTASGTQSIDGLLVDPTSAVYLAGSTSDGDLTLPGCSIPSPGPASTLFISRLQVTR